MYSVDDIVIIEAERELGEWRVVKLIGNRTVGIVPAHLPRCEELNHYRAIPTCYITTPDDLPENRPIEDIVY